MRPLVWLALPAALALIVWKGPDLLFWALAIWLGLLGGIR